jgi:hypothetical protein
MDKANNNLNFNNQNYYLMDKANNNLNSNNQNDCLYNFIIIICKGFIIISIILGILMLIVSLHEYMLFGHISYFNYSINDKSFKVLKDKANYNDAAEILYNVDNNIITLINKMTKKYHDNKLNLSPKKYKIVKSIIHKTQKNYKSHSLKENFPSTPGKDVSFNINKGDHISLCLRDFNNPKNFHEFNDIMFVAIHELAHSCTKSYAHTDEFWYNFKFLLENAIEFGIYKFVNYNKYPVNYCSMAITYTPLIDPSYSDEVYLK